LRHALLAFAFTAAAALCAPFFFFFFFVSPDVGPRDRKVTTMLVRTGSLDFAIEPGTGADTGKGKGKGTRGKGKGAPTQDVF